MSGIPLAMGLEIKKEENEPENEINLQSIQREFEKVNSEKKQNQDKKKWFSKK